MKKVISMLSLLLLLPSGSLLMAEQAAAPPSLIEQAESARKEAAALGFEWRDTAKLIHSAKEALDKGQKEESDKLASQALLQARAATAQGKNTAKNWKIMIPK